MLGAVFGDIVGSAYEWNNVKTKDFPLERSGTRYTDDSVMTLAVAKWLLEDPSHSKSHLIMCMQKLGRGHFKAGYGSRFKEWLMSKDPQPYNSWGNGSAMRVSPVALYANSLKETLELAHITANVTHNHPEGVKGALAVAECVYICREATDIEEAKREIKNVIPKKYGYNLERALDEIRPDYKFDVSCQGSVPEAIIAFLESNSLEDCVRNAVSIGGDSDTIAAIACSIYAAKNSQEDEIMAKRFEHYLPANLRRIMESFEKRIRNRRPIDNSYQVTRQIYAGEYPRNKDEESSLSKLKQFRDFGITHFVDLTEEGELASYENLLYSGASYQRFPIRDVSVPKNTEEVRKLVERIISIINNTPEAKVYIHCWGGVGRTGTIVGCLLSDLYDLSYNETMSKLEQLFSACPKSAYRETPENAEQRNYIDMYIRNKHLIMYNREYTPERIAELKPNEIFVFGSNLAGSHGGGAARLAYNSFGAIWGQGVGLQGQSYAIPTMQGGVETIKPYVDEFVEFAKLHAEYKFLVTRIGCGIAAFTPNEMAPLFNNAIAVQNVILPKDFVDVLSRTQDNLRPSTITWDAEKDFLEKYRPLMEKVKIGDWDAYYKVKELRAKEFRNTVEIANQGHYVTENGTAYTFPDDSDMMRNTVYYEQEIRLPYGKTGNDLTIVEVQNIDCLYAGVQLKEQGYNPAILNMASRRNPGGGVTKGAGAQEETLFRRTNLFRFLYQFAPYAERYGIKQSRYQYPLDRNFGGIYTPNAIYFRESEQKGYALLDNPICLSFITVAGMNRPDLTTDGMIADYHVEPIKNKIRTIFRIGLAHGHDSLVLGALGCGAFRNPPRHVARLFHEVIEEAEFKNRYRKIVFAILDDHNVHQSHNPEGNFKPFADEFVNMY